MRGALGVVVALTITGCGDDSGNGGDPPVTFAEVYQDARFGSRCSGPACHGTAVGGNLVMTSASGAYANLVGQPAEGVDCADLGLMRVEPGDPDSSLLYLKLVDPPCGDPMPIAGPLDDDAIELVRRWIADGAVEE
jgi:hypothetical protein